MVFLSELKNLDLEISSLFFDNGHFLWENQFFANLIRKGIPEIIVGAAALVFVIWLAGKIWCRVYCGITDKVIIFTTGTMFLGPIVIVNGIFKMFWGRARPRDIAEFGGDKSFSLPLQISDQCHWDCSFMSGHTAVAFWLLAPALLTPQKWRQSAVSAAIIFGIITAVVRVGQGAHFFSDVVFSALLMMVLIMIVYRKLYIRN